jgi:hypothetical protein
VPVELYNVAFIADGKLVNGGGTFTEPYTELLVTSGLSQVSPDIFITGASVNKQVQGNGFEFVQGSPLMAPYVLAAGETYQFNISMWLNVDTTGLNNDPVSVISDEFGGQSNFDGYRLNILAAAVPEPTAVSVMLLGIGIAAMRRRQRLWA